MSKPSRRERRGLIALLVVGAIPLGIAGYLSYLDIDPAITIPARAVAPVPNGFDLYVQAAWLTAQPNPPVDASTDRNAFNITAAQGAIRYGIARREAWYQGAVPGWAKFKAAQRAQSYSPYAYDARAFPGYARLRSLARDKGAATRLFAMRGEPDRAMDSVLDCVELGFDTARGGGLIPRLVCAAIVAIGLSPNGEKGANGKQLPEQLSAPQARAAALRLESLMTQYPSWTDALKNGRFEALAPLKDAFKRDNWRSPDAFIGVDSSSGGEGLIGAVQRNLISKRAVVANVNRAFDDSIAAQTRPYQPQIIIRPGMRKRSNEYNLISAALVPHDEMRFNQAREQTQLNLLLLRLALQAYRAEKGAYPPLLTALKGSYLKRIPTDDFNGGKPYFYTVQAGKYRLWSVGPDARDDGGIAIKSPNPPSGTLPWQRSLPYMAPDSAGDAVAGETR